MSFLPGFILRKISPSGFTLVEVLVATAIISIVGTAIISTVSAFLRVSQVAQDTIRAQNLANEKMEILKNMPYDSLATVNGPIYPPGALLDTETVTSGGHTYVAHTFVSFVDDPFDGNALGTIVGKPVDFYPFDYKKATIEIRNSEDERVLVKITTSISANAAETSEDTGILFLQVFDSDGVGVPNANIHLTNTNPNPDVDITTITDTNGLLQIPLLPEDTTNGYHLEVTFSGFSTDQTYPDNIPNYDPVQPDFNILAQQVTNVTLFIDQLSTLNINAVDETGTDVSGLDVTVSGDKLTYEPSDPLSTDPPVHKYSQAFTTNSSGNISIANIDWDSYAFTASSGYFVISTTPYQTVSVPAGSTTNVTLKVTTDASWPAINQVTPTSGINNGVVTIEVLGVNLPVGSTMRLTKSGETAIDATGVVSSDSDTRLSGSFDLNGVTAGTWNLVVTGAGGKSTTQTGGFTIAAP